ncbi:MAG: ADOP family duplicated permease [Blastocatellia bacterium]
MKLFRWKQQRNEELDAEIRSHLDEAIRDHIERGEAPDEARANALREFGNVGLVKEVTREMWGWAALERLAQDLRFGWRMLRKYPGVSLVAILTLAVGIGANTAIFSLLDAVLLRVLPIQQPEQLVALSRSNPVGGGESFSYSQFEQFRDGNQVFANVFGFAYRQARAKSEGREEEALIQLASEQYFSALGIKATLGRTFSPERASATEQVAVISDSYWQRRFARDPAVVGKSLTINGNPFTVIGVTPPGFYGVSLDYNVDLWVPLATQPLFDGQSELTATGRNLVMVMARLKPEASLQQASANANLIFQQSLLAVNAAPELLAQRVDLTPGGRPVSGIRQQLTQPLLMVMVIVALVLLIACANIANLLLAKAATRRREITVRLALGATRMRLLRQLLTESVLLALLGGAAGIFAGRWGSDLLLALTFNGLDFGAVPAPLSFQLDGKILGFTLLTSVVAGILFGFAPALRAARTDLISQLKENPGNLSGSRRRLRINRVLVAVQVSVSLLLLIAAGLFIRSFQNLAHVELGFNSQVVQVRVSTPPTFTEAQRTNVWDRVRDKISAYPGVRNSSASLPGLFSHTNFYTLVSVEGRPPRKLSEERGKDVAISVTPGFFATMGMPLLAGRDFGTQDHQHSGSVAILNEMLVRRLFPEQNPIGQRLRLGNSSLEVIGVVKNTKYDSVLADVPPILYVPLEQFPPAKSSATRFYEVHSDVNAANLAAGLRQVIQGIDENLAIESLSLANLVNRSLAVQRLIARLTGFFGVIGLLLACIGIYGVMSYTVAQRTTEMGIRVALGAQRNDIIQLVLREAVLPVLGGVIVGVAVAWGAMRLVGNQLFGLTANDPITISGAALLLIVVAALAAYLPARKASQVDPMIALRCE